MAAGDVAVNITTNNARACAKFDGVDDYVDVAHNANQLGANLLGGFSYSAWVFPNSAGEGNAGIILDKSTSFVGANGIGTLITSSPRVELKLNNGTGAVSANGSVPLGTWTHVLVTISSAQIATIYINGVVSGTPTDLVQPISTMTTTNDYRIGNRAGATDKTWDGAIAQVKMWNKVLTATEIARVVADRPVSDGLIIDVPLNNDYTDVIGATTNSGTYLSIVDDAVSQQISGQRIVGLVSGAYMITGLKGGQIASIAVTE